MARRRQVADDEEHIGLWHPGSWYMSIQSVTSGHPILMWGHLMVLRALFFLAALACLASPAHAQFGRTQPIYDVIDAPITTMSGKALTGDQVKSILTQTATARGWRVRDQAPGHLVAVITPRSHMAAVDITYTNKSYSIRYKDSSNLLYNGSDIHRNYNKWIKLLENNINQRCAAQ